MGDGERPVGGGCGGCMSMRGHSNSCWVRDAVGGGKARLWVMGMSNEGETTEEKKKCTVCVREEATAGMVGGGESLEVVGISNEEKNDSMQLLLGHSLVGIVEEHKTYQK